MALKSSSVSRIESEVSVVKDCELTIKSIGGIPAVAFSKRTCSQRAVTWISSGCLSTDIQVRT